MTGKARIPFEGKSLFPDQRFLTSLASLTKTYLEASVLHKRLNRTHHETHRETHQAESSQSGSEKLSLFSNITRQHFGKCDIREKTALQAAIDCMDFNEIKKIEDQLGAEANNQWEMIDFTTSIRKVKSHIRNISRATSCPLMTLYDYAKWFAENANQSWNKKYDNDCLIAEGANEWLVTSWPQRKVDVGYKNYIWVNAHSEEISYREVISPLFLNQRRKNRI